MPSRTAVAVGVVDKVTRSGEPRVAPLVTPLGLPLILVGAFGLPFVHVLGAGVAVVGIVATQGETDTESRLQDYEHAVGRPIAQDVGVGITPVPSGAAVSVTGRF